ncbi:hypothetical protein AB4Z55_26330 [Gordonia sp. ABKF26]|uniref:hypothetical protein n=1 Tax=Gordonia sp. ABKF26 TaxID=3238687 RepID=UPI0034E3AFC0
MNKRVGAALAAGLMATTLSTVAAGTADAKPQSLGPDIDAWCAFSRAIGGSPPVECTDLRPWLKLKQPYANRDACENNIQRQFRRYQRAEYGRCHQGGDGFYYITLWAKPTR